MQNGCLITFRKFGSSHRRCSKAVVKKLAIFTEKHLCWSLFNSEYCEIFTSTYFEEHLQTSASENVFVKLRKKGCSWGIFIFILKKQVKMLVFISWLVSFGVCIQMQYFYDAVRNKLQTINIYFSQSKDQKFKKIFFRKL